MGSRYALIVATDQYAEAGLRELVAPERDAEALAAVLGDPTVGDFDVRVLSNESAQEVRIAVEDFFADRDRSDTLLLHFSGHGLKNAAGELFLAATDTRPGRLASTAVGSDFLSRQMADSRAERIVLLLDCCYGGAFPRGMVVRAGNEAEVREAFAAQSDLAGGKGRAVITASSAMEYAFEEGSLTSETTARPSVFTGTLVDALSSGEADTDGDGWVGLHELFEYVSSAVRTVNPHQTPHMWTFGAQGDLLIARSKVRRVRPTPLSGELAEALLSPLAATRFGVVDLLRQRLVEADLGVAATALQTLRQLRDDDSRRVAEVAAEAVDAATTRTTPAELRLTADGAGAATAEVTVEGPPIALVVTAESPDPRIRVEYDEPTLRVVVTSPDGEPVHGIVVIEGLTGSLTLPVELAAAGASAAPTTPAVRAVAAEPPPPAPREPAPVSATPATVAPTTSWTEHPAVRWGAGGLFVVGALLMLYANRPGDYQQWKAYYDETQSGWYVYRSPDDPWVMASLVSLVAAVLAVLLRGRAWAIAAGALLGGCLFLVDDGVTFLILGFAWEDGVAKWRLTVIVGALVVAGVLALTRPRFNPAVPPHWLSVALLAGGAVLVIANELIELSGTSTVHVFGPLVYLSIAVVVALTLLSLCSPDLRTRDVLGVGAATIQVVSLYGTFLWRQSDQLGPHMAVMLPGTALIVGAIVLGLRRGPVPTTTAPSAPAAA